MYVLSWFCVLFYYFFILRFFVFLCNLYRHAPVAIQVAESQREAALRCFPSQPHLHLPLLLTTAPMTNKSDMSSNTTTPTATSGASKEIYGVSTGKACASIQHIPMNRVQLY